MKTAMIIASRELREKTRLFLVAGGLAVVPFAATLLPGARGQRADVIAIVGGFLAAMYGFGLAVALGVSIIGRDLVQRRMSFYFTKPVSASAIWVGKSAAALFVSLACLGIIAVPAALAAGQAWPAHWLGGREPLAIAALAIVALFFVSHTMSTIIRSRSPLLALDFLFTIIALAVVYSIGRPLIIGMATGLALNVGIAIAGAVLVVLAIAPVWQLAKGRSDIRRNHAALMRFLWPSVAVVLLVAASVVAWLIHVSPQDLDVAHVAQPAAGALVLVTGRSARTEDYHATFVIDRATGSATRIATAPWSDAQFSDDGRVFAWTKPVGTFSVRALELYTMEGGTDIVVSPSSSFVLSSDGARAAVADGKLLTLYELATRRIVASAGGLDPFARQQMFFVTRDVVRVIEQHDRRLRIFDFDARARTLKILGERTFDGVRRGVMVSADGARMFIRATNEIADGRTGAPIARLDAERVLSSAMLHDSSVAMVAFEDGMWHLRVFDRDGAPRHKRAFPRGQASWIVGETTNGKLLLADSRRRGMAVFDLASGVIERKIDGVSGPGGRWSSDPRLMRYAADQEFVALDGRKKLMVWKNEGRTAVRPLLPSR